MCLKELHLIDSGGLYGAEKMLLTLVARQLGQGLTPMILSAGEPKIAEKPLETEARRLGLPVIQWRMKPGLNIVESRRIIQWAREKDFDLIHTHGFKFNFLTGILPRSLRKIPQIVTLHGHVPARLLSKIWLYQTVDGFILPRAERVVIVNEQMRNLWLIRYLPQSQVTYIPNGIEARSAEKAVLPSRIAGFVKRHSINVVAVGRLSPEKGFDLLIEALAVHKIELRSIGICIFGEGGLQARLQDRIKREGLEDQIILGGYVSDAGDLLSHFDALVMPSLTEGFPITILEAMRARIPVIASSVGGIPNALDYGRCGVLVEPGSVEGLSRGLQELIYCPKRLVSLAKQAQERFAALFTAEVMADRYLKVYRACI